VWGGGGGLVEGRALGGALRGCVSVSVDCGRGGWGWGHGGGVLVGGRGCRVVARPVGCAGQSW